MELGSSELKLVKPKAYGLALHFLSQTMEKKVSKAWFVLSRA